MLQIYRVVGAKHIQLGIDGLPCDAVVGDDAAVGERLIEEGRLGAAGVVEPVKPGAELVLLICAARCAPALDEPEVGIRVHGVHQAVALQVEPDERAAVRLACGDRCLLEGAAVQGARKVACDSGGCLI